MSQVAGDAANRTPERARKVLKRSSMTFADRALQECDGNKALAEFWKVPHAMRWREMAALTCFLLQAHSLDALDRSNCEHGSLGVCETCDPKAIFHHAYEWKRAVTWQGVFETRAISPRNGAKFSRYRETRVIKLNPGRFQVEGACIGLLRARAHK